MSRFQDASKVQGGRARKVGLKSGQKHSPEPIGRTVVIQQLSRLPYSGFNASQWLFTKRRSRLRSLFQVPICYIAYLRVF
jgi:hypothetical protein